MNYDHLSIEKKWQKKWEDEKIFHAKLDRSKPKYYILDMFPYPSSTGLHVGHPEGYTATDIVSRYKRAKGFNVLHPMGWDAFGLPAEQYAIKTGIHPEITTKEAIDNFRRQLQMLGFSYDWSRELSTCDPKFFKWTQFIFKKLFERGLAYQKEVAVNWCPALKTVLANEEVVDGKSERGGHPVYKKPMKQWMLKITDYAEELIQDLELVDWPERTKEAQKNWIGKSEGAELSFSIDGFQEKLDVFTTRPDTLFGVSFMVIAPEHPLIRKIATDDRRGPLETYILKSSQKSEIDRQVIQDKTGEFTGAFAIHPITKAKIPIWTSDYVLMSYGTGAVMAVPGHDSRDFEFATKFQLPIVRVLSSDTDLPFEGEGNLVNSSFLDGLSKKEATAKIIQTAEEEGFGIKRTQYKLRDWLFSRQRFWGEPFPVVRFPSGDLKLVPDNELPVLLPNVVDYEPSDSGESPLSNASEWLAYDENGSTRETDTMPGSAGSSWYFLRYTDPNNDSEAYSFEAQDYWMPVDLYLGGPEHTVGHLLYSRFWQKVLFDAGLVSHKEPFHKLVHQGMVLGEDGEKMSKSRGNVVNPDDVVENYGADSLRLYEMFMGPLEKDKPWSDTGIQGVRRFLDRVWRLCFADDGTLIVEDVAVPEELNRLLHKTIKKVTEDIESLSFNTAISQMMILTNEMYKLNLRPRAVIKDLSVILMPFAPHMSEEIWTKLGEEGFCSLANWPEFNSELCRETELSIGVQVNGKMRGPILIAVDATEEQAVEQAKQLKSVQNAMEGMNIVKIIYRPGKILNLIVK